ncbi:MAG: hypothetical protein KA712_13130 [Myxococcales bacterium]|nr:hypothetical protein [Myxococcales bacterium]
MPQQNETNALSLLRQRLVACSPPLWACVALISALIAFRNPTALFRAEFWAEDGSCFFQGWWDLGYTSLWTPVTGYQLFLSRLIAWLSGLLLPIVALPYAYAATAMAVNAFCIAYFVRDGFSWLLPSRKARLFVALVIAIGPGTAEVFLNLANLQATLTWLGVLLLLEKPWQPNVLRVIALIGLFLSTGSAFVMGPLLLVLLLVTRRPTYFALGAVLGLSILLNTMSHTKSMEASSDFTKLGSLPEIIFGNFSLRFFLAPFLGEQGALPLFQSGPLAFWSASCVAALVAAPVLRGTEWLSVEKSLLLTLALSVSLMFGAVALTRAYNAPLLQRGTGYVLWDLRYSFLPGATAALVWLPALLRLRALEARLAVALLCFHALIHWSNVPARPDLDWPTTAGRIEKLRQKHRKGDLNQAEVLGPIPLQPASYPPMRLTVFP